MSGIESVYQKNRGFTLIEIIIGITIASIVVASLCVLLGFSINAASYGDMEDEILLNGKFGMEYIKDKIQKADLIISSDKIKDLNTNYPSNIGFVILNIDLIKPQNEKLNVNKVYNYSTYYIKDNKLVRIARDNATSTYPTWSKLQGYNEVCEMVLSMKETNIDFENKIINLSLSMGKESEILELKSTIFIRCSVDY